EEREGEAGERRQQGDEPAVGHVGDGEGQPGEDEGDHRQGEGRLGVARALARRGGGRGEEGGGGAGRAGPPLRLGGGGGAGGAPRRRPSCGMLTPAAAGLGASIANQRW